MTAAGSKFVKRSVPARAATLTAYDAVATVMFHFLLF